MPRLNIRELKPANVPVPEVAPPAPPASRLAAASEGVRNANMTVRDGVELVRGLKEIFGLVRELQPQPPPAPAPVYRPAPYEPQEYAREAPPRPFVQAETAPPPPPPRAVVAPASGDEAERAEVVRLAMTLDRDTIRDVLVDFLPSHLEENGFPSLGCALGDAREAFVKVVDATATEELQKLAGEVARRLPSKDLKVARALLENDLGRLLNGQPPPAKPDEGASA